MKKLALSFLISTTFFAQARDSFISFDGGYRSIYKTSSSFRPEGEQVKDAVRANLIRGRLSFGQRVSRDKNYGFYELGVGFARSLGKVEITNEKAVLHIYNLSVKWGYEFMIQKSLSLGLDIGLLGGRSFGKGDVSNVARGVGGILSMFTQYKAMDNLGLLLRFGVDPLGPFSDFNEDDISKILHLLDPFAEVGVRWYF